MKHLCKYIHRHGFRAWTKHGKLYVLEIGSQRTPVGNIPVERIVELQPTLSAVREWLNTN